MTSFCNTSFKVAATSEFVIAPFEHDLDLSPSAATSESIEISIIQRDYTLTSFPDKIMMLIELTFYCDVYGILLWPLLDLANG